MTVRIIDGRAIAKSLRSELGERAVELESTLGRKPSLRFVVAGSEEATILYANRLVKTGQALGVDASIDEYPESLTDSELAQRIDSLNEDATIDGVIVGMPLPAGMSREVVSQRLDPRKDLDGITIVNAGRLYLTGSGHAPSTAAAIMEILAQCDISISGQRAVVLGRSPVVGKPVATLLLHAHATVTICHTRTTNLADITREADILVAAAGSPHCITGDMIKPGATVVDAGINAVEGGIVGDVDFDSAVEVAGAITPVPGGVGPLTNIMLLKALVKAAQPEAHGS